LFLFALTHAGPTVAQTMGQLSSLFLLIGGVMIFKEHFSRGQWLGFALLLAGFVLFFNRRLPQLFDLSHGLVLGVRIAVIANLAWSAYGLTQKRLLAELGATQILLLLYIGAVILLLPAASLPMIRTLSILQVGMLGFACLNTVVAYGAFAESLRHWDVS